jgi:hypothetical protein
VTLRVSQRASHIIGSPPSWGRAAGRPKVLFEGSYRSYDVSADEQRFLMVKPPAALQSPQTGDQVTIMFNWFEELRRRAPGANDAGCR